MTKIRQDAARWFARMNGAAPDHPDRGRFEAWLTADPAHAAVYATFVELYDAFDSAADCKTLAQAMKRRQEQKGLSRRRLLKKGAMGLILATAMGEWLYRDRQTRATWRLAKQTGVGELAYQPLADGSTVVLDAVTAIDIAFSRSERRVSLRQGEAIFDVTRDADRPFVVESAAARVTVLGTRFAVTALSDRVRVSVDHGQVQVETGPFWHRRTLVLQDGQVAEAAMAETAALRQTDQKAATAFAFERGVIMFDRADLAEIAETLSRYRKTPVWAETGRANADPRVSAVVQRADVENFLRLLPTITPVSVDYTEREVRLSPRQDPGERP